MRIVPVFVLLQAALLAPAFAGPAECRNVAASLKTLDTEKDGELRSIAGICLVRYQLDKPEVAKHVLRILRDPTEDTLLREDLIEAFAESPLRRKVRIEMQRPAPQLGRQEQQAMDRTVSGAQNLVAVTQAMGSMEDTAPVTAFEGEFFRVLNDIAIDESSHVLLRAAAVSALEKIASKVVDSGIYDDRSIRLTRETMRSLALRDDEASYSTDAGQAYTRLVAAGVPGFTREGVSANRAISSVKSEK